MLIISDLFLEHRSHGFDRSALIFWYWSTSSLWVLSKGDPQKPNAVSLKIIEANSMLRSRGGRQHGRRGHWPNAVSLTRIESILRVSFSPLGELKGAFVDYHYKLKPLWKQHWALALREAYAV